MREHEYDPLSAARGILIGMLIGTIFWIVMIELAFRGGAI